MAQIFISYSKHNIDFARHLRGLLQAAGFEVWMDEIRLSTSQHWAETLESTITGCNIFMIILSPEAKSSQWVARELMLAERIGKPIFPILYSGDVWWNLANIQYEDMRAGLDATLSEHLVESVEAVLSGRVTITSDPLSLPSSQTDSRRLEAAMPAETKADSGTEVWAKISLPNSDGLRGELPAVVSSGDVIHKGDARATTFPIQFPVDPQTGKRLPATAELRVIAGDFVIAAPGERAAVEIPPDFDSRTVIFTLEPKPGAKTSGRTRVFIDLIYEMKIVAQISVSTQLVERVTAAVPTWNLAAIYAEAPVVEAVEGEALRGNAGMPLTLPEIDLVDDEFDAELPDDEFPDAEVSAAAPLLDLLPADDIDGSAEPLGDLQTLPVEQDTAGSPGSKRATVALLRFASAAAAVLLVFVVVVIVGSNQSGEPTSSATDSTALAATQIQQLATEIPIAVATEAVAPDGGDIAVAPLVDCTGEPGTALANLLQGAGFDADLLSAGITDQAVARATPDYHVVAWGACSGDALWLYVELLDPVGREMLTTPPTITLIIPVDTVTKGDSYATRLVMAVTEYGRGGGGEALVQAFNELAETAMDEEDAAALVTLRDNASTAQP
ncbi:MAG: toll/interleukin-1 receptor domain-containing protein [Anaerolineae bacterium]|nr:toll/interleukin-1 receptor domain-containing protein [Anaerolineae bacterium]